MAYNKEERPTGLSNSRAPELGFPSSSEMKKVPEQRRQMPFQHKDDVSAGSFDQNYLQPVQPVTDLKTQGAQFQVVPQRLDPGVASFLRSDAVMKQQGAQQADVFNRLNSLEKQQQSRDKMGQLEGLGEERLAALVNLARQNAGYPFAEQAMSFPSPQEQSMFVQAPDIGGAEDVPQEEGEGDESGLPEGGFFKGSPDDPEQTPEEKKQWDAWANAGYTMKVGEDGVGQWVDANGVPQEGDMPPGFEEDLSGMDLVKSTLAKELEKYEDGGEVEEALLYEARNNITNKRRELDMMLSAQGGVANVANNPALAEMAWQESKGLISAQAALEKLQATLRLSAAQAIGNIEMAEKSHHQRNTAMLINMMVEFGWEPADQESFSAMMGYLNNGDMDELQKVLNKSEKKEDDNWFDPILNLIGIS